MAAGHRVAVAACQHVEGSIACRAPEHQTIQVVVEHGGHGGGVLWLSRSTCGHQLRGCLHCHRASVTRLCAVCVPPTVVVVVVAVAVAAPAAAVTMAVVTVVALVSPQLRGKLELHAAHTARVWPLEVSLVHVQTTSRHEARGVNTQPVRQNRQAMRNARGRAPLSQ